jgi:hypothetical protein
MRPIGCPRRHVVGRKDNVVIVNFHDPPDPPRPYFPGGGALRLIALTGDEALSGYEHYDVQRRYVA